MKAVFTILSICILASPCMARDIHVSTTGSNSNSGEPESPFLTIRHAIDRSASGDVIHVKAGLYSESWLEVKEGTRLVSADGVHAARIYSGASSAIRLVNDNSGVEGFEIYGDWNQGSAGDGLIRVLGSNNTWVKNCKVHDSPHDCDVFKIGGNNVLIENCIIYNPAHRQDGASYQECIDIFSSSEDPNGVTVRNCWIYHTAERGGDFLIYAKGGARNILWENNVFGPAGGTESGNPSTGCGAPSPAVFPACENFIARNNIFINCTGDAAFSFTSSKNAHVYNNVFYNYRGGRSVIQFHSTQSGGEDRNEDCFVHNNIFLQSNGKPVYQDRGRWSGGAYTYIPENFGSDYNIYHQVDASASSNDVDIAAEANSISADPGLAAPAAPDPAVDDWSGIVASFLPGSDSPAIDAGRDLLNGVLYNVPHDIRGASRPVGDAFDIGVHEYGEGGAACTTFGDGLSITIPCLDLGDARVSFTLDSFYNPDAFLDLSWKLDETSIRVDSEP